LFIEWFSLECRKLTGFTLPRYMITLKCSNTRSRRVFIQSKVKPKQIVTRPHAFSRALLKLHVITSGFDCLSGLSVSLAIGQSDYVGLYLRLSIKTCYSV